MKESRCSGLSSYFVAEAFVPISSATITTGTSNRRVSGRDIDDHKVDVQRSQQQRILILSSALRTHTRKYAQNRISKDSSLYSSRDESKDNDFEKVDNEDEVSGVVPVEQIRAWRELALKLRNEAEEEERALKKSRLSKEEELDHFIESELFLSIDDDEGIELNACVQIEVLKKMSSDRTIAVFERLIQRKKLADQADILSSFDSVSFNIADRNNSKECNLDEKFRMRKYMNLLVDAQELLDQYDAKDSKQNYYDSDEKKAKNVGKNTRNMSTILSAKLKECQKEEEVIISRKGSILSSTNSQNKMRRKEMETLDLISQTIGDRASYNNSTQTITFKVNGEKITAKIPASSQNVPDFINKLIAMPMWVPSYLLPFIVTATTNDLNFLEEKECVEEESVITSSSDATDIDWRDLKTILTNNKSNFYCTGWDSICLAAIYRGNFKTDCMNNHLYNEKEKDISTAMTIKSENTKYKMVFDQLQSQLVQNPKLNKQVQLFFLEDPEWRPNDVEVTKKPNPVILAVAKSIAPEKSTKRTSWEKLFFGFSVISTVFTTFGYAVSTFALNNDFFEKLVNQNDLSILLKNRSGVILIIFGITLTSLIHEFAHHVSAKIYNMKIGLAIPLPSLQLGTFGSITPMRSFPPSRSALFDFALSGPLTSLLVSLMCLSGGILLTINCPGKSISSQATVPAAVMKSSFLVGLLVSVMAPKIMMLPLSQPIPVHPLFFVGLSGLVASAVNLLPLGRLDGGRACTAVFGRRIAYFVSFFTLLFVTISALSGNSNISIFWGLLVTLFQRAPDIPTRDEITEVGTTRFRTFMVSIGLSILILAPFPGGSGAL